MRDEFPEKSLSLVFLFCYNPENQSLSNSIQKEGVEDEKIFEMGCGLSSVYYIITFFSSDQYGGRLAICS